VIEKAENQQTLADFLLLAQNVEKELASTVQSIDMVQDEKKSLLKTHLKSEPLEERLSDDGQAEEPVRLNMDSHTHSVSFSDNSIPFNYHIKDISICFTFIHFFKVVFSAFAITIFLVCHLKCHLTIITSLTLSMVFFLLKKGFDFYLKKLSV
jgi:hypothetical protein